MWGWASGGGAAGSIFVARRSGGDAENLLHLDLSGNLREAQFLAIEADR